MSLPQRFNKLTVSQRQCAEFLANLDLEPMTTQEIADKLGVSTRTIYRWKKDPLFIEYQNYVSDRVMQEFLTETYTQLRHLLRNGKSEKTQLEAIKLVLQTQGKLKDNNNTVNVQVNNNAESQEERERRIIEMEKELLEFDND